jgi:hypothetical protein
MIIIDKKAKIQQFEQQLADEKTLLQSIRNTL